MQNDICWREGTRWSKMTGLWPLSELLDMLWKWWSMACWRGSMCSKILPKEHHLLTAYVIHSLSWHPMERMYAYKRERGSKTDKYMSVCTFVLTYSMGVLCKHLDCIFTQRHAFFCRHVYVKEYVNLKVVYLSQIIVFSMFFTTFNLGSCIYFKTVF